MAAPTRTDFLTDFLSDIARRERRNLLFASTTGIFVAHLGLVPMKLSALGIEFSTPEQSSFLVLVALVIAYFIGAFGIYGLADFFIWRHRYHEYQVKEEVDAQNWTQQDQEEHDLLQSYVPSIDWLSRWIPKLISTRVLFDFVLPLIVGIYAVGALVFQTMRA